jgi:hypothetical protein
MHHNIDIVNPIDYRGWDELLASNQECTFFHTAAWAKVLAETYHYHPLYFTLSDDNKLVALIPMMEVKSIFTGLRGVSLPFTDYCQAIITKQSQLQDMVDFVKEYGRKCNWKSIEIRGGDYPDATATAFFYRHRLKLVPNSDQIFSQFKDTTQRNIRKATRQGVEVNVYRSLDAVKEYYRLHCITRKKHGSPPQPWSFFEKIYEHIISKGLGFIALASYGKINIAGAVFFNFREKSVYKFGASNSKYQHLRANNLIMWEAIKLCAQNGHQSLCLGRTEPDNTGLRRFKAGWGTEEQVVNYYRYDLRQNAFVTKAPLLRNAHRRIFSIMPTPLLKMVGSMLYKHIG